jgi:hypothetical protein
MRKILASMVILATFAVMPAHAQFKFGVKAGMNNTRLKLDYENAFSNEAGYGWFIGPTAKVSFPLGILNLGADGAVLYDERNSKTGLDGAEETIKQKSIIIPLNVRMNFSLLKMLGAYVATGPQFGFNVGNSGFGWGEMKDNFQLKKSQFSWNVGLGVMVMNHLDIGVAYNFGLGRTGELQETSGVAILDTPKQKTWVLSAAYYF